MNRQLKILRLDASANPGESASRLLGDRLIERLRRNHAAAEVRVRDLNAGPAFIDADWIDANLTPPAARDGRQDERLGTSDALIAELEWADQIVLTTPMYNFGVPATLKAWIDQVCRAGITFRYTDQGPVGLLEGKRADIVITTGGVPLDSPVDFASGYLKQVFGFIGIEEVNVIGADQMNIDPETSFARALEHIDRYAEVAAA